MPQNDIQSIDEDEIDIKEVLETLRRYKYSIILFAVTMMTAAAIYAYFKPNIYSVSSTIELKEEKEWSKRSYDFMLRAFYGGESNIANQMLIIKSRFVAKKALNYLNIGTRYFTKDGFKRVELYKDSPFIVNTFFIDRAIYGKEIKLKPIDNERFLLRIDPPSQMTPRSMLQIAGIYPPPKEKPVTYNGVHRFDETIATPWFKIKISRFSKLEQQEYQFSITPNKYMADMIQGGLSASLASEDSSIIMASHTDTVPLRAVEILNAVTLAYLDQQIEIKTAEADQTLKFMDQQIAAINTALEESQDKLKKFKNINIVVDISQKATITTDKLSEYESKVHELDMERDALSSLKEYMKNHSDITGIVLGSAGFSNRNLLSMVSELKQKMIERNALLVELTELHPAIIKLSESVNSLRKTIRFTIENTLSTIQERKISLMKVVNEYRRSLEALPEQEQKLANLTRITMVNEKIYSFLLEKRTSTAILRSSTISKTRVIDEATIPSGYTKPKRSLITLVGLILGLIIGIAYAFLREFIDNTIKSEQDIERLTTIPLYGVIPRLKEKKGDSSFQEAYRSLRTNLEFLRGDKPSQTILVTSAVSGEGKTTVASNLAIILSKSEKKVLLIDLDMRQATLHKIFDLKNETGVSILLSKKENLSSVLQHTRYEGLSIITSGPTPPNPSELIMSDYAKDVMSKLREQYDYIIIDTPPMGLVSDASILMHRADVSLLVTRYSYTKKEFIKSLDKMIRKHQIDHTGIILNDIDFGKSYGYGYGQKYGEGKYW